MLLSISRSLVMGFPGGAVVKSPSASARDAGHTRRRSDPWVGQIPGRSKWQPAPVFLPGESQGQRRLVSFSPWGREELEPTAHTNGDSFYCPMQRKCYANSSWFMQAQVLLFGTSWDCFSWVCFIPDDWIHGCGTRGYGGLTVFHCTLCQDLLANSSLTSTWFSSSVPVLYVTLPWTSFGYLADYLLKGEFLEIILLDQRESLYQSLIQFITLPCSLESYQNTMVSISSYTYQRQALRYFLNFANLMNPCIYMYIYMNI